MTGPDITLDARDWTLIRATQGGLPLAVRPYHALAEGLGWTAEEVMQRLQRLLDLGVIRRIAAVPNHYALGYTANGMTVWDVDDAAVDRLGAQVAALPFVTHCYRRPRRAPQWPYNLFAMLHGRHRQEVEAGRAVIRTLLGAACRGDAVLYSERILKKTGMRL